MSRFPITVTRYLDRNNPKKRVCISGTFERPKRKNCVMLYGSMFPSSWCIFGEG
jgi:hypothetical protein